MKWTAIFDTKRVIAQIRHPRDNTKETEVNLSIAHIAAQIEGVFAVTWFIELDDCILS